MKKGAQVRDWIVKSDSNTGTKGVCDNTPVSPRQLHIANPDF